MNRVQTLRSSVAKSRPTGRQPGELYVNFPDAQLGVVNAASAAQDLIGVRFFSTLTSYAIGDFVIQAGQLYRATQAIAAGAFNAAQWAQIGGTVVVSDALPSNPQPGELWFDSVGGQLYCFYDDGNSKQWVVANTFSGGPYLALSGGTMTGLLTPGGGIKGVVDGSDAAAGQIGEVISSVVTAAVTLTSGVAANVTSISLTPGDWDVQGEIWLATGTGGATGVQAAINTVSATNPAALGMGTARFVLNGLTFGGSSAPILSLSPCRASLSATTTYYLISYVAFPSGTVTATGKIWARRAR